MKESISANPAPVDLSAWAQFQKGLSLLLDMPLALYDSDGNCLVPSVEEPCVCAAISSTRRGGPLCAEMVSKAIAQVIGKGNSYIFKCHANKYFFAVPVILDSGRAFVLIGGRVYLDGSVVRDFYEGVIGFGLSEKAINALRPLIKTVPAKSIFMIPDILNSMAVPFLKRLVPGSRECVQTPDAGRLKGLKALEQVYKSLAPVLDREELYETILAKSSELVGAERGSLMIVDSKNKVLSVKAAKGMDKKLADGLRVKIGEGISGSIAARGVPVIVRDIEDEVPSWKNRPRYRTKSFISIPLKLESKVIGVINMADKSSGEVFSDEDLHLLQSFANYASIALERGAYYSMSEELKLLSMTDPLTGLFNRRYFRERLFEEVERVKRHDECFTTFIIDIDNFKSFNDRFGHLAGDEVLRGVAKAIRDAVRSMDVVARYGGEEFAVILPHTNKKDSTVIAERIRKGVQDFKPSNPELDVWPTISLGVAEFPGDASHIDDLINKADKAMYLAKKMGKNKVVLYER